ncbi:MAG: hypothetical protein J7494_15460, partial [Sphingobium sp.]|nr:hypothetical protein [Sphingobium sp.]
MQRRRGSSIGGGTGDDVYLVDSAADSVSEADGEGFDIVYAMTSFSLAPGSAVERLSVRDHLQTTAIESRSVETATAWVASV